MEDDVNKRFSLLEIDPYPPKMINVSAGELAAKPVEQLVLRFDQLPDGDAIVARPRGSPDVAYRMVSEQVSLCGRHAHELASYLPGEELRAVLPNEKIESLVLEFGLRREDLMHLHGRYTFESCAMCGVHPNTRPGGKLALCHNDDCKRPLHSEWPTVYCSTRCAEDDHQW